MQNYTLNTFEQFGTLQMHNRNDKAYSLAGIQTQ